MSSTLNQQLRLLPSSPIKLNILQSNNGIVNQANQNLLKLSTTISAKADSTAGIHSGGSSGRPAGEVAIDPKTGVPFKKHHHSVKKFQTPSVSRRNARERNRVKQVNDGFSTLKLHIPHLKNKTSKVDTLRAAVDYIRQLRCLLGQPIKDEHLHQGPVLITDMEEARMNRCHDDEDSFDMTPGRCDSSLSNPDLMTSLICTLPPMALSMINDGMRSSSPTSSVSSSSNHQTPEVDSTNGTFCDELKENLTYNNMEPMDFNDQSGQANWTWTSALEDQQQHTG